MSNFSWDPEAWQTELGFVLSSVETFDACQRARLPGLPVDKVDAKIERQIKEDTAMTRPIPIPMIKWRLSLVKPDFNSKIDNVPLAGGLQSLNILTNPNYDHCYRP
ncbi:uncharacterized protein FSUBG_7991 [Fusarium subglutinans]|uniref:Uncharacterized protein n=1 Tax=Gibberella subglutinans TaxID=42677 RepID=A0A8H5UYG8_GIBSU|nr:uncharacterized protein FSUBG_7991 [Fusarium subglutinans]KAF5601819.1 hypothetical protein FSUBG_7991 [Fusarium subglutinans]